MLQRCPVSLLCDKLTHSGADVLELIGSLYRTLDVSRDLTEGEISSILASRRGYFDHFIRPHQHYWGSQYARLWFWLRSWRYPSKNRLLHLSQCNPSIAVCFATIIESLSARANTLGGIVRPIGLAVLRFITSSNFFGCSTGESVRLVPFTIYPSSLSEPHDIARSPCYLASPTKNFGLARSEIQSSASRPSRQSSRSFQCCRLSQERLYECASRFGTPLSWPDC